MELNTNRLLLREIELTDREQIIAIQSDLEYIKQNPWEMQSQDKINGLVNLFISWKNKIPRTQYQLAVIKKDSGEFIGSTGIHATSMKHREAEFGIRLKPDSWGKGYAHETTICMLEFAFEELKLHRVSAETISDNNAAVEFCNRIGFSHEGRFRQHKFRNGKWYDSLRFAILEDEWQQIKGKIVEHQL